MNSSDLQKAINKRQEQICFNQSMSQNSLVSISLRKKKINKLIENLKEGKINKNFQDRMLLSRFHETIIIPTAYEQRENQIQCKLEGLNILNYFLDNLNDDSSISTDLENDKIFQFDMFILKNKLENFNYISKVNDSNNINDQAICLLLENMNFLIYKHLILIRSNYPNKNNTTDNNNIIIKEKFNIDDEFLSIICQIIHIYIADITNNTLQLEIAIILLFNCLNILEITKAQQNDQEKPHNIQINEHHTNNEMKLNFSEENLHRILSISMIIWKSSSLDDNLYKYSLQIILCLAQNNFFSNNERGLNLILQNDFIISNLEKIYNKLKNIVAASNQDLEANFELYTKPEALRIFLCVLKHVISFQIILADEGYKKLIHDVAKMIYNFNCIEIETEKDLIVLLSSQVLIDRKFISLLVQEKELFNYIKKSLIIKYDKILRLEYLYFIRNLFYNCDFNLASKVINMDILKYFFHIMKNVQDPSYINIYLDALGYLFNIDIRNKNKNLELEHLDVMNYHYIFHENFPVIINRNPFRKLFANLDGLELFESLQLIYTGDILKRINNIYEILELENDPSK